MKNTLLLVCLILSFRVSAQITINQSHMPSSGDTIRYSSANAVGFSFDPKSTGADQKWDFSNMQSSGQDLYQYLSANKTLYLFYFFNQIGLKTTDSIGVSQFAFKNIYSFYTKNSSVFKAEGLGYTVSGIPLAASYTDEDEIYQFPLNYGDSDVSTFHFLFSIPGQTIFSYVQAGKRTNMVDGWGSIETPYKKYTSVIRVKTIVDEVDTLISQFARVPFPRKQVIYKWLSTDEKIPVLEITGTELGGTFTPVQIRYRDSFRGMSSPLAPRASFTVNKKSGFVDADTFTFTDASTPFATSVQWDFTPAADVEFVKGTTKTSRNPACVFHQRGNFTVKLTAANFAGSDDTTATDAIAISYGLGIPGPVLNEIVVYPNPAQEFITVRGIPVGSYYEIFSISGTKVLSGLLSAANKVNTASLAPGSYVIRTGGYLQHFQVIAP